MFYNLKSTSQSLNYRNGWQTVQRINIYIRSKQHEKIWDKIIYWQERKDVFCLRNAKTRRDWNRVRKLLILKVNLTFLIFKGVKLSRPLKLSQRVLLLKAREFLYIWCHFAHSWYIQCNNKISHKYNNVEENIWLVKKENWYNLILSVKGYYNQDLWKSGITIKVDIKCLHQQLHLVCSNNTWLQLQQNFLAYSNIKWLKACRQL